MDNILEISKLCMHFPVRGGVFGRRQGTLKAVDDVSLSIAPGETLGLVGESGCGKSTIGRCIVRLLDPTSGTIRLLGKDITHRAQWRLRNLRSKVQMVFQDPAGSLNPRMTVRHIITEPLIIQGMGTRASRKRRVDALLELVGLPSTAAEKFPHEFSGGQRQRISIARTLALDPKFIVCDEPISALDVSIQAQIINLLEKIQDEMNISYLFIAHDLGAVKHISQRIGAMYLGSLVEIGESEELYRNPLHPYTKALLSAIPIPDPQVMRKRASLDLDGEIPSPLNVPTGCAFRTRCPKAMPVCAEVKPELQTVGTSQVACHLYAK